ncbi:unnamed protein product [Brassicogethes aeneus]|uniref:SCP domain-containing protein n=1 Tax=Brassicogethes aeneus TaxID=1431903 RepID=A0A9P0AQB4_BRAAE|nr:unnamed protein product [Brassicogethes aeneus]
MVRKTDQRTFASIKNGEEPTLETVTRETIETFRGQRTEYKVTTEKKDCDNKCPPDVLKAVLQQNKKTVNKNPKMNFTLECLKAHNECRLKHGCKPLKLNKDICKISQQWADVLIRRNAPQQSNNRDLGENIYSCQSTDSNFNISGKEVVETWYSEIQNHQFGVEPKDLKTGHFTQVVWKDSRELGVGFAKSGGKIIVVTNYEPPGNFIGQFSDNVPSFISENNNTYTVENNMPPPCIKSNLKKGTAENFEVDFLNKHNELRKLHGVPPLKLDRKLCKYSETWAEYLATKNVLQHRPESNYGENIFSVCSTEAKFCIKGEEPVVHWYNDMKNYPFGKEPKNLKKGGHFTQVIWKSSEYLGVGVAKNNNKIYVVANYSPAGNFVGFYVENVPPPLKSIPNTDSSAKEDFILSLIGTEGNFREDFLKAHNIYRKLHGSQPLSLDEEICIESQIWANHLAATNTFETSSNEKYGENIYTISSSDPTFTITGYNPVDSWYDEVHLHDFTREPTEFSSLHFTQVVWKSTKTLGVGVSKSEDGTIYVVANYFPPGNYQKEYLANVGMAEKPKHKPAGAIDKEKFAAEALSVHNEYRRKHGVAELVLNKEMSDYAQEWAETLAKKSSLTHRANNKYGENIFSVYSSDFSHVPSARDAVKEWYDEGKHYTNYAKESINQKALHFTQVVWKESKELGVGVAKNQKGQTYVIANYNPRGNVGGHFVNNVLRPK